MSIFVELSLIVFLATAIAAIMRLLKQPLVLGYIVSGIIAGPYVLNILHSTEQIELFSKIGISILLFIVGLHLNPDTIKETGKSSLITGGLQVVLLGAAAYAVFHAFGLGSQAAFYSAIALTFSSTIIVLKLLSDRGDLSKLHGKMAVGILLIEDIVATVALLALSVIGLGEAIGVGLGTTIFQLLIKGSIAIVALYLISKYILPKLAGYFAYSQELLFLFSLTWGLGLAAFFYYLGFSIEIGALIAGVTLSVSSYSYEIASRMKPLQDFFIVIFFILLGAHMVFTEISRLIVPIIILSLLVLILKPIIIMVVMNLLGFRTRTAFKSALALTQISEFSLILMSLALSFGVVDETIVSMVAMVAIITITASTYLMMYSDRLYAIMKKGLFVFEWRKKPHREPRWQPEASDMIIFGYDRVGFDFVDAAQKLGTKYIVVDYNPKCIRKLQAAEIPFRFGDAEDVEFLNEIALGEAKIVVSTIPDFKINMLLLRTYRKSNDSGIITLISHDIKEARELYLNGASYVTMPHYLGAHHASNMISQYGFDIAHFERERNKHLTYLARREKLVG